MTQEDAFLQAIRENSEDDTLRLVYADWLEERGDPRAEFIRVQCQLEPLRENYEDERAEPLRKREDALLRERRAEWLAGLEPLLRGDREGIYIGFRRGFVDTVALPVQWFLEHAELIRRQCPLLRRLDLFRVAGWGEQLANCPHLQGLSELEVACWINAADLWALAASPYLGELQVLQIWNGRLAEAKEIPGILARGGWPRLRELRVFNTWEGPLPESDPSWIRPINEAAGRQLVRYFDPHERLYPIAADFDQAYFPGRLPDGTQVFGCMPADDEAILPLLLFSSQGDPLEEREMRLPPELVAPGAGQARAQQQREHHVRLERHLKEVLGFQPAFIRVKSLRFQTRDPPYPYIHLFPWDFDEFMAHPDDPEVPPEKDQDPRGNGGSEYHWLKHGLYVFDFDWGDDWYIGANGRIDST